MVKLKHPIQRSHYIEKIEFLFQINPVVAILGPRQCGKTTLARLYADRQKENNAIHWFDLENPDNLAGLEAPMLALQELRGLIVIDEIQKRPDLFKALRVLVDQQRGHQHYLILGSASRDLIQQSSETLAGRISYMELNPFSYPEVDNLNRLWIRGGFPESYLSLTNENSWEWRKSYISTFLERDIPNLGIQVPPQTLRRFWMMLAHYHGHIFNSSDIGKSLGVAHTTARHYLDILTGTFMIRELPPWLENIDKRQIKSPKIYFRDSGIYHYLLNVMNVDALYNNPKLGASWEGFAIEEIIRHYNGEMGEIYFWGIHNQGELDLLIIKDGKRLGFEFKYTDRPAMTKSMNMAIDYLQLDTVIIIYPGKGNFPLTEKIRAVGLKNFLDQAY
ncbi:MAG: hypothetical protein A3E85_04260 [Gammaproteobacteria bacterium RIFCSPHIGHO2_12_FULL_45_12]|nr:MAG: hypothetical protein A3E85_04260 [Gammaproteobacteria bacterium RIFCSPHIGHO2_12_FULL_45_12]